MHIGNVYSKSKWSFPLCGKLHETCILKIGKDAEEIRSLNTLYKRINVTS